MTSIFSTWYSQQNKILLALILLTLIRGLIYASVTPPWWQSHDEDYHFAQIKWLLQQWSPDSQQQPDWLPEMLDTFSTYPLSRWSRASGESIDLDRYSGFTRNSLSYYLYAGVGQSVTKQTILFQLFVLRLISVIITSGVLFFAFLSAKLVFSRLLMAQVLVVWLILFNPSFMIINSAINDGNLTVLLCTIIFYLLSLEISAQRFGWRLGVALALTFLSFWSKVTAFFLIPIWSILFIIYAVKINRRAWLWLPIAGVILTISSFFLPQYFQARIRSAWNFLLVGDISKGITYALSFEYFRDLFASFWIILGHAVYWLDQIWYLILTILSLMAIIGLIICLAKILKQKGSLDIEQKILVLSLTFFLSSIIMIFGHAIADYALRSGRLARFLFPAIVPLSILMVTGWQTLLPSKWRNTGLLFIISLLFLFDTMVWLNYAIPWYYPFWPS